MKIKPKSIFYFIIGVYLLFMGLKSQAGKKHREHEAHVHGAATMNITLEKNEIDVDIEIPGIDAVGFEHEAKTKEETLKIAELKDFLKNKFSPIAIAESFGCQVSKREVEYSLDKDHSKKTGHEHKHEHKHDHSEFEIEVSYKCKDLKKLKEIEAKLFNDFKSLKKIKVQLITQDLQKSFDLTPNNIKMVL